MQFRRIPAVVGVVALILSVVTAAPSGAVTKPPARGLDISAAEPSATKSSAKKGTITGKVTFRGKPAKNVLVVAGRTGTSTTYRTRTDAKGRYTLRVPAKKWRVHADPRGLNAYITWWGNAVRFEETKAAKVRKGRSVTANIKLAQGVAVKGRVVDAQGLPVPKATLEVRPLDRGGGYLQWRRVVKSDENGRYTLLGLPAGRLDVLASLPGDRRHEGPSGAIRVRGSRGTTVRAPDIVIRPAAEGVITADVDWDCDPSCPALAMPVYAVDDAKQQRFTLEKDTTTGRWAAKVPPGSWRVVVNGTNLATDRVQVSQGATTHAGEVRVPQLTGTITGSVLRKNGEPVPSGTVVLLRDSFGGIGRHVKTTQDGSFRAEHVAAGSHTLHVLLPESSWGAEPDPRTVTVRDNSATTAKIRFKASRTVKGTVTHKGKGVEAISVVLRREYPLADIGTETDAKGRFTLRNVPSGTFTLVVSDFWGPEYKVVRTTLTVKKSRKGLTITLRK